METTQTTQTRSEIINEMRGTQFVAVGSYESEPFTDTDSDGDEIEKTAVVDVRIVGRDDIGYTLVTCDTADGPDDDLGQEVYATLRDAVAAVTAAVTERGGTTDLFGIYADAA